MVTKDNVLRFLFRATLGDEFRNIENQQSEDEIILSCLCLGWNDAFRRTLKNKKGVEINRKVKVKIFTDHKCIDRFREYANTKNSADKATILEEIRDDMAGEIKKYKKGKILKWAGQKNFISP